MWGRRYQVCQKPCWETQNQNRLKAWCDFYAIDGADGIVSSNYSKKKFSNTSVKLLLGPRFWSIYTQLALLGVLQNTNQLPNFKFTMTVAYCTGFELSKPCLSCSRNFSLAFVNVPKSGAFEWILFNFPLGWKNSLHLDCNTKCR